MIRIAYLDDHSSTRAGLEAILTPPADLVPVGGAASEPELWPLLARTHPDVVLLDLHHAGVDGLTLCRQIKRILTGPRVILHLSRARPTQIVAAYLADADAVVSKGASAQELMRAIRLVAGKEHTPIAVDPAWVREAAGLLAPEDHAILAMRLAGTVREHIASTLGIGLTEITERTDRMIDQLTAVPA